MLDLTLGFFLIAGCAAVFAGVSKGGFGSGASFASAVVLALILEPGLALGVMLPLLMLIDAVTLRPYWGQWRWRESLLLIAGGVPGVALGALFFQTVDADVIRVLIGVIAILFVLWQLGQSRGWVRVAERALPDWVGLLAGVVAGFTSFVSHAGGPPAAVYLLSRRIGKTMYQASTVLVFFAINIAKFVPYAFLGLFTQETAIANMVLAPFAILGAWAGVRLHHLVPERLFFGLTYVLLVVTGLRLVWIGLS